MKAIGLMLLPALALAATGCKVAKDADYLANEVTAAEAHVNASALPNAVVYKTNGDYYDNVPVTLNEARTEIVSWPAPSDISSSSRPVRYADGWLLDRRGISPNTAFLNYTYAEYEKLPPAIGRDELFSHVIPASRITEIRVLPIKLWQALENPVEASKLVGNAQVAYTAPEVAE